MNLLSSLEVQIDVAEKKLFLGGNEVSTFHHMSPPHRLSACLVKFGRVYSPADINVPANSETVIWGKVHSCESEDWTGMVEVTEDFKESPRTLSDVAATAVVPSSASDHPYTLCRCCGRYQIAHL